MIEEKLFLKKLAKANEILQYTKEIEYQYNARTLIYQHNKIKLYHYHPKSKQKNTIPLLIVFATVNRPEILDLFPNQSFIGNLLTEKLDIYLLDWGYPSDEDSKDDFNQYITCYLHQCIKHILEKISIPSINLLGICQGGLLSLCYSILYNNIKNLILISTPIDFTVKNYTITHILKKLNVDHFSDLFKQQNIPGKLLKDFFISLRPMLLNKKYFSFVKNIDDADKVMHFLQVEKWLNDTPNQANKAFIDLLSLYRTNQLIQGDFYLNNEKVELNKITLPLLNIMARNDKIVPMQASRAIQYYISSTDYSEKIFSGGHIGIYINPRINQKMAKVIAAWINQRTTRQERK